MGFKAGLSRFKEYRWLLSKGIGTPLLVLASLGMVVLPIPPLMLDILFSFNIALSIVVLLVAVYTRRPLEFAAFPTVLLIATLLRLALNVASTRVVLLEGHNGSAAAGHVIEAFGNVVIGGNYAAYTIKNPKAGSWKAPFYAEKARMLPVFYAYVQENKATGFAVPWSKWLASHPAAGTASI